MPYDLRDIGSRDIEPLGSELVAAAGEARSMEEAASAVVRFLYEQLVDSDAGRQAMLLVRLYKTHAFGELEPGLERFAREAMRGHGGDLLPSTRCLTLLGTTGDEPDWCDRRRSVGHQAIPLPSVEVISKLPMIARLVSELGFSVGAVVSADRNLVLRSTGGGADVFHVRNALGSPYIPAQKSFVEPYDVRSVVGFGGLLGSADLFAVILFSRTTIPRPTAELMTPLAGSIARVLLPFVRGPVFTADAAPS